MFIICIFLLFEKKCFQKSTAADLSVRILKWVNTLVLTLCKKEEMVFILKHNLFFSHTVFRSCRLQMHQKLFVSVIPFSWNDYAADFGCSGKWEITNNLKSFTTMFYGNIYYSLKKGISVANFFISEAKKVNNVGNGFNLFWRIFNNEKPIKYLNTSNVHNRNEWKYFLLKRWKSLNYYK